MDADELRKRTKQYGLRVIKLVNTLPASRASDVIGKQLLRAGTSVGANYYSACRARSRPDFIAKVSIAIEEADECIYWMELLIEAGLVRQDLLADLLCEANEITAILTASAKTAKSNLPRSK